MAVRLAVAGVAQFVNGLNRAVNAIDNYTRANSFAAEVARTSGRNIASANETVLSSLVSTGSRFVELANQMSQLTQGEILAANRTEHLGEALTNLSGSVGRLTSRKIALLEKLDKLSTKYVEYATGVKGAYLSESKRESMLESLRNAQSEVLHSIDDLVQEERNLQGVQGTINTLMAAGSAQFERYGGSLINISTRVGRFVNSITQLRSGLRGEDEALNNNIGILDRVAGSLGKIVQKTSMTGSSLEVFAQNIRGMRSTFNALNSSLNSGILTEEKYTVLIREHSIALKTLENAVKSGINVDQARKEAQKTAKKIQTELNRAIASGVISNRNYEKASSQLAESVLKSGKRIRFLGRNTLSTSSSFKDLAKSLGRNSRLVDTLSRAMKAGSLTQKDMNSSIKQYVLALRDVEKAKRRGMSSSREEARLAGVRERLYHQLTKAVNDGAITERDYAKALKEVNISVSKVSRAKLNLAGVVNKLSGMFGKLKSKVLSLKHDFSAGKDSTSELSESFTRTSKSSRKFNKEVDELKSSILDISPALRRLSDSLKNVETTSGKAGVLFRAFVNAIVSSAIDAAVRMVERLVSHVRDLFRIAGKFVTSASDFTDTLDLIRMHSGATSDELSTVADNILRIGMESGAGAQTAAEGVDQLLLAGMSLEEVYTSLPHILDLATAGSIDFTDASENTVMAIETFGLSVGDTQTIVDSWVRTADASVASVSDLMDAFGNVAPTANSFGLTIEDVNTALGLMSQAGIRGATAGSQLRTMLQGMARDVPRVRDALDDLGVSLYDDSGETRNFRDILNDLSGAFSELTEEERNNYIQTIAGRQGMNAMLALLGDGIDTWDDFTESIERSNSASEIAGSRLETFKGRVSLLSSAVEYFSIKMGEWLIDSFLSDLVNFLNIAIPAMTDFIDIMKGALSGNIDSSLLVSIIEDVNNALTDLFSNLFGFEGSVDVSWLFRGIVSSLETLRSVVRRFINWWSSNDLGRVISGGVAVATESIRLLLLFVKNVFTKLNDTVGSLWNSFVNIFSDKNLSKFVDHLIRIFNSIRKPLENVYKAILDFVNLDFSGAVRELSSVFDFISVNWSIVSDDLKDLFSDFVGWFASKLDTFVGNVSDKFLEISSSIWDSLKDVFPWLDAFDNFFDDFLSLVERSTKGIRKFLHSLQYSFTETFDNILVFLSSTILEFFKTSEEVQNFIDKLGILASSILDLFSGETSFEDFIDSAKEAVESFIAIFGSDSFKNLSSTLYSAVIEQLSIFFAKLKTFVSEKIKFVKGLILTAIDGVVDFVQRIAAIYISGISWGKLVDEFELFRVIDEKGRILLRRLGEIFRNVKDFLLKKALAFIRNVGPTIIEKLSEIIPVIYEGLRELPSIIGNFIKGIFSNVDGGIREDVSLLDVGFAFIKNYIKNKIKEFLMLFGISSSDSGIIASTFMMFRSRIIEFARKISIKLGTALIHGFTLLLVKLPHLVTKMMSFLSDTFLGKLADLRDGVINFIGTFASGIVNFINNIPFIVEDITSRITGFIIETSDKISNLLSKPEFFSKIFEVAVWVGKRFIEYFLGSLLLLPKLLIGALYVAIKTSFGVTTLLADAIPKIRDALFVAFAAIVSALISAMIKSLGIIKDKFSELINELFGIARDVPGEVIASIEGTGEAIKGSITDIMDALPLIIGNTFRWLLEAGDNLVAFILNIIVPGWGDAWNHVVSKTLQAGIDIINGIKEFLANVGYLIVGILHRLTGGAFPGVLFDMVDKVKEAGGKIVESFSSFIEEARAKIVEKVTPFFLAAAMIVGAIIQGIMTIGDRIRKFFSDKLGESRSKIEGFKNDFLESGNQLVTGIVDGMKQKANDLLNLLPDNVREIILDLSDKISDFATIGKDFVQGIIDGIVSMTGDLFGSIRSLISGLVDEGRDALEAHSPSRLTAREFGEPIIEGMYGPIEDSGDDFARILEENLLDPLADASGHAASYWDGFGDYISNATDEFENATDRIGRYWEDYGNYLAGLSQQPGGMGDLRRLFNEGEESLQNLGGTGNEVFNDLLARATIFFGGLGSMIAEHDVSSEFLNAFGLTEDGPVVGAFLNLNEQIAALADTGEYTFDELVNLGKEAIQELIMSGDYVDNGFWSALGLDEDSQVVDTILTWREQILPMIEQFGSDLPASFIDGLNSSPLSVAEGMDNLLRDLESSSEEIRQSIDEQTVEMARALQDLNVDKAIEDLGRLREALASVDVEEVKRQLEYLRESLTGILDIPSIQRQFEELQASVDDFIHIEELKSTFEDFRRIFEETLQSVTEPLNSLVQLVVEKLQASAEQFTNLGVVLGEKIVEGLVSSSDGMIDALVGSLQRALSEGEGQVQGTDTENIAVGLGRPLAMSIMEPILDLEEELGDSMLDAISVALDSLTSTLAAVSSLMQESLPEAFEKSIEVAESMMPQFIELGEAIIDGIVAGMDSNAHTLVDAIRHIIEEVVFAGREEAEVGSPSKLMMRELGEPLVEGITSPLAGIGNLIKESFSSLNTGFPSLNVQPPVVNVVVESPRNVGITNNYSDAAPPLSVSEQVRLATLALGR